jgi:hypothetical protein
MPQKISQLEAAARDLVGDGANPNLFFVTVDGVVVSITRDATYAYNEWRNLKRAGNICGLEDRKHGTIASRDKDDETGLIVVIDDFNALRV